ncbi:aspartyl-phosphate phosphatase Spo0E family protein [Tissierella pigra]|uniref:Spo0E family sporulation regulatory protein-aspartic acid phosphatase n=1 Tax=Tissierella pigra TaxID=2607614 RepID=A0A6N7Y150_9FIRM|nr:aspartyl-phosphate phosphatase Spo0E family protein [Tissierella pigra]MSU02465.1 Spo0E family sporulation regulatory protein-aspartic acid phosphatase [Tissierella pigra]
MKNKINNLREHLHQTVKSNNKVEILQISQELDKLIIEYHKEEDLEESL